MYFLMKYTTITGVETLALPIFFTDLLYTTPNISGGIHKTRKVHKCLQNLTKLALEIKRSEPLFYKGRSLLL